MSPENKALMERYPQYYRDVSHLEVIDVYRVIDLFNVTDPTAQHALKKLLLSGERTGGKSIEVDLKEARDTLSRGLAMRAEDANKHQLGFDFAAPGTDDHTVLQLASNDASSVTIVNRIKPANPPGIRFCSTPGCEMRVRDGSGRCIIHAASTSVRHKSWCEEKCPASACSCQHMPDPQPASGGPWVTPAPESLCKDEGCPHHGTDHACVTPTPRPGPAAGMPRRTR